MSESIKEELSKMKDLLQAAWSKAVEAGLEEGDEEKKSGEILVDWDQAIKSHTKLVYEFIDKPKVRRQQFVETFFADAESDLPIMKAGRQIAFVLAFYTLAGKPGKFVVKQLFEEHKQTFLDSTWKVLNDKLDPEDIVRIVNERKAKAKEAEKAKAEGEKQDLTNLSNLV